jgi:NurA-like 5'-3' nuclease
LKATVKSRRPKITRRHHLQGLLLSIHLTVKSIANRIRDVESWKAMRRLEARMAKAVCNSWTAPRLAIWTGHIRNAIEGHKRLETTIPSEFT